MRGAVAPILLSAPYSIIYFVWDRSHRAYTWLTSPSLNTRVQRVVHKSESHEFALLQYASTPFVLVYNMAVAESTIADMAIFFDALVAQRAQLFPRHRTVYRSLYTPVHHVLAVPDDDAVDDDDAALLEGTRPAPQDDLTVPLGFDMNFNMASF